MRHRMQTDRQPTALYHHTGRPSAITDWLKGGPGSEYLEFVFYMGVLGNDDPFGAKGSPDFQRAHVESAGLEPSYGAALAAYDPHDLEHLVRYTSAAKALVWIGNDALAKDDLRMQAELCRFTYHPYPGLGGYVASGSLFADLEGIADHPHVGVPFGRAEGWVLDTMNAAYSMGTPGWRQQARPYYDLVVDLVAAAQIPCSGFIQGQLSTKLVGGLYRARQSIEHNIADNALRGALETVYRGASPPHTALLEQVLTESARGLISPLAWSQQLGGPYREAAVGPMLLSEPPFCDSLPADGFVPLIDDHNSWAILAWGFTATGDPVFLDRAAELIGGGPLGAALKSDGQDNLVNRASLLRVIEDLGLE